jgi:hypothetical protein
MRARCIITIASAAPPTQSHEYSGAIRNVLAS